jgi:hypothetical protein
MDKTDKARLLMLDVGLSRSKTERFAALLAIHFIGTFLAGLIIGGVATWLIF